MNTVKIAICGSTYTINTIETQEYIKEMVESINKHVSEVIKHKNVEFNDALILSILNYADGYKKNEVSLDNVRKELQGYISATKKMDAVLGTTRKQVEDLQEQYTKSQELLEEANQKIQTMLSEQILSVDDQKNMKSLLDYKDKERENLTLALAKLKETQKNKIEESKEQEQLQEQVAHLSLELSSYKNKAEQLAVKLEKDKQEKEKIANDFIEIKKTSENTKTQIEFIKMENLRLQTEIEFLKTEQILWEKEQNTLPKIDDKTLHTIGLLEEEVQELTNRVAKKQEIHTQLQKELETYKHQLSTLKEENEVLESLINEMN